MKAKYGMLFVGVGMISVLIISFLIITKINLNDANETVITIAPTVTSVQSTDIAEVVTEVKTVVSVQTTESTEALTEAENIYLNINKASAEEFAKLDGIGEVIADEIIKYRASNGAFLNIEELINVNGIGYTIFERIKNNIYVENPIYTESDTMSEAESVTTATETETQSETREQPRLEDVAPININTASKEELMLLPHVTEEIAISIIELRESIHKFSHVYELLYVDELEQKQVSEIIDFVTVGQ